MSTMSRRGGRHAATLPSLTIKRGWAQAYSLRSDSRSDKGMRGEKGCGVISGDGVGRAEREREKENASERGRGPSGLRHQAGPGLGSRRALHYIQLKISLVPKLLLINVACKENYNLSL